MAPDPGDNSSPGIVKDGLQKFSFCARATDNGLRQRMFGGFRLRPPGKRLLPAHAPGEQDLSARVGRRSGCRSCQRRPCKFFAPISTAFDEHPELGAAAGADHDRGRGGQSQAQGQAMTITAMKNRRAWVNSTPPIKYQASPVSRAKTMTDGTK